VQLSGEGGLGDVLLVHRGLELPGDDRLDGVLGRFLEQAFSLKKVFEARTKMRILFHCIALIRCFAKANSLFGVFRVVLKKAWSPTIVSSRTQNNNLASCFPSNDTRNSCRPPPIGRQSGIPSGQPN
jgi:hypothetical protein